MNNELRTLDSDLFEFNPQLISVAFSGNNFKFFGENIFEHLTTLRGAFFKDCSCICLTAWGKDELQALKLEMKQKCPSSY